MKAPSVRPVRCAIYTRVSTEHGLDQEFNSLDAQYEAASAYIKSQAGSVLLSMEWARTNKHRGFITSWPQFGAPAGLLLANIAVLIGSSIAGDQFFAWGWRIPFWLSIIMVGIGLYIRLGILETPVFARLLEKRRVERMPVIEVIKRQPKQIILTALARMAEQ